MGGKPKQTQRTKNNSRPSNSGRSAELFGTAVPSFVGFTSLAMTGTEVPVLPGFQTPVMLSPSSGLPTGSGPTPTDGALDIDVDFSGNLDTNFQLVLRKMTKKDPITKVKALQEFGELCTTADVDTVVAILPFWPRLYAQLSTDVEHRVREASQQAQTGVAVKCGKHIAPFLRQLAPAWITGQFDTYAPAASLAAQSFQRAFKAAKQQEVFTYCQAELLEYVLRNVTVVTAASMSTAHRTYTPEECEAKYQRLVTGCLKGYAQYLSRMSAEQLAEASDRNAAIVGHAKFFSHYKSKAPNVRAAWFEALTAILQFAPQFVVPGHAKEAVTSVVQTLDESEPIVLPHVWSAMLLMTQSVPEWSQHCNMEKALLPKLWSILKCGGAGCAATIYPHLLPLLSKLNATVLGPERIVQFYKNFFAHLRTGLQLPTRHQSRSETVAIATSHFECLQYIFIQLQNTADDSNDGAPLAALLPAGSDKLHSFAQHLLDEHVIAIVAWALSANVTGAKQVFAAVASLIVYWTQRRDANPTANPLYAYALGHFWSALHAQLEKGIDGAADERTPTVLRLQYELLLELHSGRLGTVRPKRTQVTRVQFDEPTDAVDKAVIAAATDKLSINESSATAPSARLRHECDELAKQVCASYMRKADETKCSSFVDSTEVLFKTFGSAAFFKRLVNGAAISTLCDKIIAWLHCVELRQSNVLDIIMCVYPHLDSDPVPLFDQLLAFDDMRVQRWTITHLLSHPLCQERFVPELLQQASVTQFILATVDKVPHCDDNTENLHFLHKCFLQNDNGDILIPVATCRGIIDRLVRFVRSDESRAGDAADHGDDGDETDDESPSSREAVLDTCCSFLAQILLAVSCNAELVDAQRSIFTTFFESSVRRSKCEYLTQDTLWEMTTAWQDTLSSGDVELCDMLRNELAAIVEQKLALECDDGGSEETAMMTAAAAAASVANVEDLAEVVAKMVLCSLEGIFSNSAEDSPESYATCADRIYDDMIAAAPRKKAHHERQAYVEHVCLYAGATTGKLSVPDLGSRLGGLETQRTMRSIDAFMQLAAYRFEAVFKMTCTVKQSRSNAKPANRDDDGADHTDDDDDDDDDECEYTEDFCDANAGLLKEFTARVVDEILSGIHAATMAERLLTLDCVWCPATVLFMERLVSQVPLYLRNVRPVVLPVLRERLIVAAKRRGGMYAAGLQWLTCISPYDDPDNGLTMLREEDDLAAAAFDTKEAYMNVLQAFAAKTPARLLPIERNLFVDDVNVNLLVKCATLTCLIDNYATDTATNNADDRQLMESAKALLNILYAECKRDKTYFLYNEDISDTTAERIAKIAEIATFYTACIRAYPHRLEHNDWDLIRIAISSWVLTVSKSSDSALRRPAVGVFVAAIYRLFDAFRAFLTTQAVRSSTALLTRVTEEWDCLFAKDVNLILLKCYIKFVEHSSSSYAALPTSVTDVLLIDRLSAFVARLDQQHLIAVRRIDSRISLDDVVTFALQLLAHRQDAVRSACADLLSSLAAGLIAIDCERLLQRQSNDDVRVDTSAAAVAQRASNTWHTLHRFGDALRKHEAAMQPYTDEFGFKSNELDALRNVPAAIAVPYLLLWNCVLDLCAAATAELRSIYATFLMAAPSTGGESVSVFGNGSHMQRMLASVFRLMPVELLRNQDAKHIGQQYFAPLDAAQLRHACATALANGVGSGGSDAATTTTTTTTGSRRLACHTYVRALRHLPAAVRKWWHDSGAAQKTLVDRVTTSFVSAQLCQDELRALVDKRQAQAADTNMQLTVHTSTREVIATYVVDEARMELVVTLPVNHPLGVVRVESGKQIGGRLQGRVLVMQLTIFLTHQNGSIADGLQLWKRNLDRKFEGVQECYVCYSVIHQDTCQLPRLTCRKCKNKFHGPCLYKWFSTSNKSTCPICRSIF